MTDKTERLAPFTQEEKNRIAEVPGVVEVPTWVLAGLIRCGEFNEQHGITSNDGQLWDDDCRKAMAYVRESGLRDDMLVLHGPRDFVHPRDRAARDEREAKRLDGPQR